MIPALALFVLTYVLMLALPKFRPFVALISAALFVILGYCGLFEMSVVSALGAVDYNVLLMISGTMLLVSLFIDSLMPAYLAEVIISHVPNVKWAVCALSLFAGVVSAFVDNVATVLMIAPVGLAIAKKLSVSPVPVLIAIAVSSNLQGAATMVGDTTSMLLGGFAGMDFLDFFWMLGRPGIFWGVELGAVCALAVLLVIFRRDTVPVTAEVTTKVEDFAPTALMLIAVALLILASFIPQPQGEMLAALHSLRAGLVCFLLAVFGLFRAAKRSSSVSPIRKALSELDVGTVALLFGLFIVIEGVRSAGVIDAAADFICRVAGGSPFLMYTAIVFFSVLLSAFIDNIPYVAAMLPVVQSAAAIMGYGDAPHVFYFGLLTGATLGGNLTPIGASANITAIGILRKNGESVTTRDFLRIGVPFTLAAVISGYIYIWLVWHP